MVELPEAAVLAAQITSTLKGKHIARVVANASPHKFAWFSGDPAGYPALLQGRVIEDAASFGNYVEIHAVDRLLVLSTPIKYHMPGDKLPPKHQLFIEFEDCTSITSTVVMWGGLFCFPKGEKGGMPDYYLALQKPSPLSADFTWAWFQALLKDVEADLCAKELLATEQRIPGLGNGVLQDILWKCGVNPRRKLSTLSQAQRKSMYYSVQQVLKEMAARGGRDTERDLFDQPGGYRTVLSKNTAGTPCPVCGSKIKKETYLGGSIYFCPACQSL